MEISLAGYFLRMVIALLILAGLGYLAVKYVPGRFKMSAQKHLRVVGYVNLGKDAVYILSIGPDVVAVFSGRSGGCVIGKWSKEDWDNYEALSDVPPIQG